LIPALILILVLVLILPLCVLLMRILRLIATVLISLISAVRPIRIGLARVRSVVVVATLLGSSMRIGGLRILLVCLLIPPPLAFLTLLIVILIAAFGPRIIFVTLRSRPGRGHAACRGQQPSAEQKRGSGNPSKRSHLARLLIKPRGNEIEAIRWPQRNRRSGRLAAHDFLTPSALVDAIVSHRACIACRRWPASSPRSAQVEFGNAQRVPGCARRDKFRCARDICGFFNRRLMVRCTGGDHRASRVADAVLR
jgi:hypothetical protein